MFGVVVCVVLRVMLLCDVLFVGGGGLCCVVLCCVVLCCVVVGV